MKRNSIAIVALCAAALAMPAMAATKAKVPAKAPPQASTRMSIFDAATGEGEGVASGAPTAFSGQVFTGDLDADFARNNNPSNGTSTNLRPKSPSVGRQLLHANPPQD